MSYRQEATDWYCSYCNYSNFRKNVRCRQCSQPLIRGGDWPCRNKKDGCIQINSNDELQCVKCGSPKKGNNIISEPPKNDRDSGVGIWNKLKSYFIPNFDVKLKPKSESNKVKRINARYNTLFLENTTELQNDLRLIQQEIKAELDNNFLVDHRAADKGFHITFMYFGNQLDLTEDIRVYIVNRVMDIPEKFRTITLGDLEVFHGRRDNYLVLKLEVPELLKQLRNELYVMYDIKDSIKLYNPHITLGKIKNASELDIPSFEEVATTCIINKRDYLVRGIEFY